MPSITQLEYLLAVEEERHFGRAAEKCHVSQPSLSTQIQKLEDELELVIFDRSKKPIMVTSEGEQIINQAREVLKEHKKLFTMAAGTSFELKGDLHLAVIPTLSPYVIPLFLEKFSKLYPQVKLKINEYQTEDIIKFLKMDSIDAAILVTPLKDEQIIEKHLFFEPFYAFLSDNHPLRNKKNLGMEDLKGEDLWLLEEGHCFREQMLQVCSWGRKNKVLQNVEFASGSLETLTNLVRTGSGYTLLPELAVKGLNNKERELNLKKFKTPIPTREVSIVYSRSFLKERIIEALEKTILENIPKEIKSLKSKNINVVEFGS
jgi:LysR family hydrogen peroxide-inducible transcriptional activator